MNNETFDELALRLKNEAVNKDNSTKKEIDDLFDKSDSSAGVRYLQREVAKIKAHLGLE